MLVLSYYVILFFSSMKSERFTKFCWMMMKILLDLTPAYMCLVVVHATGTNSVQFFDLITQECCIPEGEVMQVLTTVLSLIKRKQIK